MIIRTVSRRRAPAGTARGSLSGRRRTLEYGLAALLIFSPLPAASVNDWSILIVELAAVLLAAAYLFMEPKPHVNVHMTPALKRMRIAVAGFFGLVAFQLLPLPAGLVRFLSPGTHGFHRLYDPDFARMKFMTLSVAPSQTLREGLELLAYFIVGFLVIHTVTHGRQIRAVIMVLIGLGVFESMYGLYELTTSRPRILFYAKAFSPDSVTGTFVNKNHLSGYLEMILPLAVGLVIARTSVLSFGAKGLREKFLLWTSGGVVTNLLVMSSIVVMALGIINSHSRSGLFVLVFSFFLIFGLSILTFSRTGFRQMWIKTFVRVTFVVILIMSLYVGIGSTIQRFAVDDLLHENRPLFWANVTGMMGDFPVFGTGLGTFVSAYPAYEKRGGPDALLTHAHNDYLEYASELGLVGSLFLFGGIFYLAGRAFLTWRERRNPEAKGLALGGIVSLAGMGLHAMTDFNLHIPANMLLFTIVLSLTFVSAFYRKA